MTATTGAAAGPSSHAATPPAQPDADETRDQRPGKRGRRQRAQPAVDEPQLALCLGALATAREMLGDAPLLASTRRSTHRAGQRATYPRALRRCRRGDVGGEVLLGQCVTGPHRHCCHRLARRRGALSNLGVAEPLDLRHPQHLAQVRRKRVEGLLQHGPLLEIVLLVVDDVEVVARRLTTASTAAPAARALPPDRAQDVRPEVVGWSLPATDRPERCREHLGDHVVNVRGVAEQRPSQPTGPPGVAPVEHGVGVGVAAPQALKDRGVGLPGT